MPRRVSRALWIGATIALPAVLLLSSLRTFRQLDEQRAVYLRQRVSVLAARLETLPAGEMTGTILEVLAEEEPNLVGLEVIQRGGGLDTAEIAPLWEGKELFRTGFARSGGGEVYRAYIPFHAGGELRIARMDLNASAADFLIEPARNNVMVSLAGGLALVGLSLVAMWSVEKTARLKVREAELQHLAQVGTMAAALAHEIRNPLGTIKGFVQLAAEMGGGEAARLLEPALKEVGRLEALVNDLLAYGRPRAPEWAETEWAVIAATIEEHARQLVGERAIRVEVSRAPVRWVTDGALVTQALLNLVRNAVEAIPAEEAGEVRIAAEQERNGEVVLTVADTGVGIPAEVREHLFEAFYTTKPFGTGLGLAITRRLVESLGGRLELEANGRKGTKAVIRLWKRS